MYTIMHGASTPQYCTAWGARLQELQLSVKLFINFLQVAVLRCSGARYAAEEPLAGQMAKLRESKIASSTIASNAPKVSYLFQMKFVANIEFQTGICSYEGGKEYFRET